MRGAIGALAMLLAVLAAGCDSPPGRAFSAQFPPMDMGAVGDVNRGPLPVELRDLTGTVVAIATDEHRPELDFGGPDSRVGGVPDRPNALWVTWLGGMCTKVVRMHLSGTGGGLVLAIRDEWDPPIFGGVCPAGGVPRAVLIGFDRPINANDITIRTGDG